MVLLFFSLSAGKRSLYIFPAAPALALVAGCHAHRLLRSAGVKRLLIMLPAMIATLIVIAAFYAAMNPHRVEEWLVDVPTILKTSASLFVTGAVMLTTIIFTRVRRAPAGFAAAMVVFWFGLSFLVAPSLNNVRSGAALMNAVEREISPSEELAFVAWPEQFLLQWDRPTEHFGYRRDPDEEIRDATLWLSESSDRRLLLPDKLATSCFKASHVTPVGRAHRRNWVVANDAALTAECLTSPGAVAPIVVSYSPGGTRSGAGREKEVDEIDRRIFTVSSSN